MTKILLIITGAFLLLGAGTYFRKTGATETITILQTADIHAYLNPHKELFVEDGRIVFREAGGLSRIKTLVDDIKNENPDGTLFIDGGDLFQGSGASMRSQGKIFPPIIRQMGYDLLIPGNWEVIYGKQVMLGLMKDYNTRVIASNMYDENDASSLFPQYWVTEKKGVKIGFIAYNDPEVPVRQNPRFSEGIQFTPVEENLKQLVSQLKNEEAVDVLFLVTHLGISKQIMLADHPAVEGVDFILGNDTHERIRKPIQGKYSKVLEPGAFGSFVGRLDLKVRDKKLLDYSFELLEVKPETYKADAGLQKTIDQELAPYQEEMQEVLGYTSTPMYRYLVVENPMDNFITDALRWKTGADIAVSNGFRFGVPILPGKDGKAPITRGDLWRMLPVNEHMKTGKVSGQQVKDWLEKEVNNVFAEDYTERFGGWLVRFSGMRMKFNSSAEKGKRVEEIYIKGEPLDLEREYTIASCNRTGEPLETMCRIKDVTGAEMQSYTLHDAVAEYLSVHGTVSPRLDGRAVASDLGEGAFSQMEEGDYRFE